MVPYSKITQNLLAVAPPNVQFLTTDFTRDPVLGSQQSCNPPQLTFTLGDTFNLGQGNFTPLFMEVAGFGSPFNAQLVFVADNIPAVIVFDLNGRTLSSFSLVNNATPLAASASPDGSQVFVGACDTFQNGVCTAASVHIVNTGIEGLPLGDVQQTPFFNPNTQNSMCTGIPDVPPCVPDLVAVQPK
jgi:hypothetical protein